MLREIFLKISSKKNSQKEHHELLTIEKSTLETGFMSEFYPGKIPSGEPIHYATLSFGILSPLVTIQRNL